MWSKIIHSETPEGKRAVFSTTDRGSSGLVWIRHHVVENRIPRPKSDEPSMNIGLLRTQHEAKTWY